MGRQCFPASRIAECLSDPPSARCFTVQFCDGRSILWQEKEMMEILHEYELIGRSTGEDIPMLLCGLDRRGGAEGDGGRKRDAAAQKADSHADLHRFLLNLLSAPF
jgi:hypothetical protein